MLHKRLVFFVFAACFGLAGCGAAPTPPALAVPLNPKCTTCDDFIACGDAERHTLYHLRPKSMLAQMATILDYLLQAVWQRARDQRAVDVYPGAGPTVSGTADLDLREYRIAVPDGVIDQRGGRWLDGSGAIVGRCRVLPAAEGFQRVRGLRAGG
jgi:hypothetical protein